MLKDVFYSHDDGSQPLPAFLNELGSKQAMLQKLLSAAIRKTTYSDYYRERLLTLVDDQHEIYEVCWSIPEISDDTACALLFLKLEQEKIILTNGYMKKQHVDPKALALARSYKTHWERLYA